MGELLSFEKLKEDKELLKKIFHKINNEVKQYISNEENIKDDSFIMLYNNFLKIYDKVLNESWIKIKNINKFINNIEQYSKDEDIYNSLFLKLEYINLIDATNADVLEEDSDFTISLLHSICESDDIVIDDYKDLYNKLKNNVLKSIISTGQNINNKKIIVEDLIDMIKSGYNIFEIKSIYERNNNEQEKLDSINNIHNYYLNQVMFVYNNFNEKNDSIDEMIDNIDMIIMLNHYNQIIKNKFIYIVNEFEDKNIKLTARLKLISDLVEIFLSLDEDLNIFDSETIKNMAVYKSINSLTADEAINSFKDYMNSKGGMKK